MSSSFGNNIKVEVFGESHGKALGVTIDGLPAGESIDFGELQSFLNRRKPGKNFYTSKRVEADIPEFLSGLNGAVTSGSPICAVIKNEEHKNSDYESFLDVPRPGHADYPAAIKYNNLNDKFGGGHFSGRLTAPICVAGGICKQILEKRGIYIGGHILSVKKNIYDSKFDPINVNKNDLKLVSGKDFPIINDEVRENMQNEILKAINSGNSVGGIIECAMVGLPVGLGEPIFDGIESKVSQAVFSIPAVKGIEFGLGFKAAEVYGSENNDEYFLDDFKKVKTKTNNCGGILGGLSNGMPIIFKVAVKPTPSISKKQNSVNLKKMENQEITIEGRHDPCIVPRAVPCVEAVSALAVVDMCLNKL